GGLRVLRYGPMRAQLRGIEAVLSDGTVLSHMSGLVKDNTGYDYPSLLAGSEGTLAVITAARPQLVARVGDPGAGIVGAGGPGEGAGRGAAGGGGGRGVVSRRVLPPGGARPAAPPRRPGPAVPPARAVLPAAGGGRSRGGRGTGGGRGGPAGGGGHRRGRAGKALGVPGTPPRGGRVPRCPAETGRLRARLGVGAAGVWGCRRHGSGRPGRAGDHLRPRRGRQPARERGADGGRRRPPPGRGFLAGSFARRIDLRRARHRRAQGALAPARAVSR